MPSGLGSSSDQDQPTIPPQGENSGAEDRDVTADPANATAPAHDATIAPTGSPAISPGMPQLQDYELLEELGRGGMGVVYKARQKKLDRIVALKMILGGQFASEEAVRRFELEAETAARLDHPGIVPIYEIGHSHGNHFFSMKLIEGSSLAERLETYQSDPRKAVELMIEITQAVQHAHERGVLHRDLKPANILIDNDGQVAVTDLGLAKHLDDDVGLTQTGLVMGSPGFMSPEQAAGKSDITTAADVYSLGAILYWLITGRPPFQSDSRLEVIMQTIDSQPESIRVHRPGADRDLNLICQKALLKSPSDRYSTAMEFAEDLTAWLEGDALSVKPPTTIDLARIWIRKNFRTVALASTAGILCGLLIGTIILMLQLRYQVEFSTRNFSRLGETTTPWDVRYFSWIKFIPRWLLNILPPSMVLLNVAFGIWVIGLIKPKSREIGLVAATAAALLSGIVAYTVSLGWAPIKEYSIDQGSQDIELISDALWMDEGRERDLARRALTQRYPGLQQMDANERGYVVYQKILTDQSLGVPKGMWVGIGTTLFLTVLPLFFAATFSGLIWDEGSRGWVYFGRSIELGIYSALFFLVMTKFVTNAVGPSPGIGFQLVSLAGIGLGLYLGVTDRAVVWRIIGFVIVNLCLFSNFSESARINNAGGIAASATTPEQLATASHYLEKKLTQNDDPWTRFQLGILAAYRGDDERHAEQCRAMLMNFQHIYRPNVAERIVKVSLLKPEFLSDSEQETVYELAEIVSGYGSSLDREWLYFARAMSEMRQGNLAETLSWNAKCREASIAKPPNTRVYLIASTYVVDALAYQQTGKQDEFDLSIANAKETIEKADSSARFSWQQRMVCKVLLEEATGSKNFE